MASGILGQSAPSATTDTTVYTVPASTLAVLSVSVTNRGAAAATVRIALSASGTPTSCLLYTSPSPRDAHESRMPSSA